MNYPAFYSSDADLDRGERQFIFALHDISELIETKQIDFYVLVKHLSKELKYRDADLQFCLEQLVTKETEEGYFDAK